MLHGTRSASPDDNPAASDHLDALFGAAGPGPARAGARFTAEAFTLAFEASPDGTQSNAAIGALSAAEEEAEAAILARLDRTVSLHCEDRPLSDAMDDLAVAAGVKIRLDYVALEDASIGPDTPVNCELSALTLRSALRYCLGKMDLTFVVKNEMILITTPEKAGNELITRVYPVRDLVLWRRGDETLENYQQLIDVVTATIAPTTWDEVGGPGAIHEFRHSAAIVISQTREVHEQVASLLTAVRRARDVQRISVPGAPARAACVVPPRSPRRTKWCRPRGTSPALPPAGCSPASTIDGGPARSVLKASFRPP